MPEVHRQLLNTRKYLDPTTLFLLCLLEGLQTTNVQDVGATRGGTHRIRECLPPRFEALSGTREPNLCEKVPSGAEPMIRGQAALLERLLSVM